MSLLPEKVQAEETGLSHEEMINFKARAERDRLFGLWLAKEYLHLDEAAAGAYAQDYVRFDFDHGHRDGALLERAHADLVACGRPVSLHILERHLHQLSKVAHENVERS
ncbi:hypothetical protein SAMN07250955_11468 [Arboricoccus pini]|uniref:DUF1476 domain-containing protein n=1 Tax=Arboricoccus pini TaxID=1963835 RepID=A0A212RU64_9PROT|nr:ATPase inhibitor subunit zeta [Arboricoccus pini]SNB76078.1 hypothetical protein SAMN07250955_11468 [Arboricoccus pini]